MFHKGLIFTKSVIYSICYQVFKTLMLISTDTDKNIPFVKYRCFPKECFSCRILIFLYAKVDYAVGKAEESGPPACIMAW